jgi:hypothetical protein
MDKTPPDARPYYWISPVFVNMLWNKASDDMTPQEETEETEWI